MPDLGEGPLQYEPFCAVHVVTKGGDVYDFDIPIDKSWRGFARWWDDRWMHEPLLEIRGQGVYISFDSIMKLSYEEFDGRGF